MMTRITCLKLSNHWRLTTKLASWRLSGLCVCLGSLESTGKEIPPQPPPPTSLSFPQTQQQDFDDATYTRIVFINNYQ
jgi:hypothetical protein